MFPRANVIIFYGNLAIITRLAFFSICKNEQRYYNAICEKSGSEILL